MIKPTISWEVDLFGKIRRMSEADRAQMLATDRAAQGVMVSLAVAFLIILLIGDPFKGLIYSQMILSIQLPFTVFLQVHLTSSERVMGKYQNSRFTKYLLYGIGAVVTVLNVMLLVSFFR